MYSKKKQKPFEKNKLFFLCADNDEYFDKFDDNNIASDLQLP